MVLRQTLMETMSLVSERRTLHWFSYIGFVTQKIALENKTTVNAILVEDISSLEEVQIVAFSKRKKVV